MLKPILVLTSLLVGGATYGSSPEQPATGGEESSPGVHSASVDYLVPPELEAFRTVAADCSQSFLPELNPNDPRYILPGSGNSWVADRPANARVLTEYAYRQVEVESEEYALALTASDYPWLASLANSSARLEGYDGEDFSIRVASRMEEDGGCTRIVVRMDPPVVQVGLLATRVSTNPAFVELVPDVLPEGYSTDVALPAVAPGEGRALIKLYRDGVPVHNETLYARMDARGLPGRYGTTLAHEHIAKGFSGQAVSSRDPTIIIQGANRPGQEIRLETNEEGEVVLPFRAGYRGGPETLVVRTADSSLQSAATIIARHREFISFAQANGFRDRPEPSPRFPFLLTGWTADHYYNHFIDATIAGDITRVFRAIWEHDRPRMDGAQYFQMNDMSLEYGGAFRLRQNSGHALACTEHPNLSHRTHNVGLDFDVSPCYSVGEDGKTRVPASPCEAGSYLKIDREILASYVIHQMGGSILLHSESIDDTPYHYHIRFSPSLPARIDCGAGGAVSAGGSGSLTCRITNPDFQARSYQVVPQRSGVIANLNIAGSQQFDLRAGERSPPFVVNYTISETARSNEIGLLSIEARPLSGSGRGLAQVRFQVEPEGDQ